MLLDGSSYSGSDDVEDDISQTDSVLYGADKTDFEDSGAGNLENSSRRKSDNPVRRSLINKAKDELAKKGINTPGQLAKKALGDTEDTPENRERVKNVAAHKARKAAKNEIGKRISNEGVKKGFEKGLSKSTGKLAKQGAKKVTEKAGEALGKKAVGAGAKAVTKEVIGKGVGSAVGAATGIETLGLGFLLGFLINIAISLGISDAIDCLFEIKNGDIKQARFLAERGSAKVGMFIVLLLLAVSVLSVAGVFAAIPLLFAVNIYMVLGFAFKKIGILQGLVWWEIGIIVVIDIFAFLILMAFLGALGWYLCGSQGDVSSGIVGAAAGLIAKVYDWWNKTSIGSVAADFCTYVNSVGPVASP